MASCEKCWCDARGEPEEYSRLIKERETSGPRCTPEQQAGKLASECPNCQRKTIHEICKRCMACGYGGG